MGGGLGAADFARIQCAQPPACCLSLLKYRGRGREGPRGGKDKRCCLCPSPRLHPRRKVGAAGGFPRRVPPRPPRHSGAASLSSPAEEPRPAAPTARGRGRVRQVLPPHPPLPRLHRRGPGGVGGRLLPQAPRPPPPQGEALGPGGRRRLRRHRCLSGKQQPFSSSSFSSSSPDPSRGRACFVFHAVPPPSSFSHEYPHRFTGPASYCRGLISAILVVAVNLWLIRNIERGKKKKALATGIL